MMKTYSHNENVEEVVEPIMPQSAVYSVLTYIAADLAVTALCSFTLTPLLVSYGIGNVSIVLILTFISFAVFGLAYWLFKKVFLKQYKRLKEQSLQPMPVAV